MRKCNEGYGCIYLLTNLRNGKRYVGQDQSGNPDTQRWKNHIDNALNDRLKWPLYCAIRKAWRESSGRTLGFSAEVIWRGPIEKLDEKEIYYIAKLHTWINDPKGDRSYNLVKGGGGVRGLNHSKTTRNAIRLAVCRRYEDPVEHDKQSVAQLRSYEENPERAKKQRAAIKIAWQNEGLRTQHSKTLQRVFSSVEVRKRRSEQRTAEWADPVYYSKMLRVRKNQNHTMCHVWLQDENRHKDFCKLMRKVNRANWVKRRLKIAVQGD